MPAGFTISNSYNVGASTVAGFRIFNSPIATPSLIEIIEPLEISTPRIKTNLIVFPDPLFAIARITNLSISQSWRNPPSGTLNVRAHKSKLESILDFFTPTRELSCYGLDFICGVCSVEFSREAVQVTIPLQSSYSSYGDTIRSSVDKPIQINLGSSGTGGSSNRARGYSFNYVARQSEVQIFGSIDSFIPVSGTEPDNSETVTLKDLIDDIALIQGKFPDYSKVAGIALKDFRLEPIYQLYDWEIKGLSYDSTGGFGATVEGIGLAKELNNAELIIDRTVADNGEEEGGEDSQGFATNIEGDPTPEVPPTINRGFFQESYSSDYLRVPTHSFDSGGITKTKKTIKSFNGETVEEIEETYGFVYTSLDVFVINVTSSSPFRYNQEFLNPSIDAYWDQVSYEKKVYSHDSEGNYTGFASTGWKLQRFKQESESLELLDLKIEQLDPATGPDRLTVIAQLIALYTAQKLPISSSQINFLARMDDHYSDITDNSKYVKKSFFSQSNTQLVPDPESTDDDPLPLIVAGENKTEETYTTVISPQSSNSPQVPERYQVRTFSTDSSGQSFRDSASINQVSTSTGRPAAVSRLSREVPEPRNPTVDNRRYRVKTPNALPQLNAYISTESIGFTGGTTYAKVLLGAQTQISHINTEQSYTITVELHNRKPWIVGERIRWNSQVWTILSISEVQSVRQDKQVYCDSYSVSLGKFLDVPIALI
jgi:hypothetical protein